MASPPEFDPIPQQIPLDFQRNYRARLQVWKTIIPPGLVLVLLILLARFLGLLQPSELWAFDLLLRHRPLESPDPRITLVGITEADIQALNHYPIYDAELSQALRILAAAQPRVLGLDLFRDVQVPPGYDQLQQTFEDLPNVVAIEVMGDEGEAITPAPAGVPPERVGFANVLEDSDWMLRRALLTSGQSPEGQVKSAFALRLAQSYLAPQGYRLETDAAKGLSFDAPQPGARANLGSFHPNLGGYIRAQEGVVDQAQLMLLKFRQHPQPFEVLTLTQVLKQQFDPDLVRDRIVLMGNIAPSSKDYFLTAGVNQTLWASSVGYEGRVPFIFGLEVHAHIASQIISLVLGDRRGIGSLPEGLEYAAIALAGLAGTGLGIVLASPLGRLLGLGVLSGGLLLLCYVSLTVGLWLPLVPSLMALMGAGLMTLFVDRELRLKLRQSNATLEWAYNAVHNGPLQSLVLVLRQSRSNPDLYQQLTTLNDDLRLIYDSMRDELNRVGDQFTEEQFYVDKQRLNARDDLPDLLLFVHQITLNRNFPGFDSLRVCMRPQLEPLRESRLTPNQRRLVCAFLEEALCNVGKHAVDATRLDVVGVNEAGWYRLQVMDNGRFVEARPDRPVLARVEPVRNGETSGEVPEANGVEASKSVSGAVPEFLGESARVNRGGWMGDRKWRRTRPREGQGTRQARAIARALGGKYERLPRQPHGTICQLSWPNTPPRWLRFKEFVQRW